MTSWTSFGLRAPAPLSARTRPESLGRLADLVARCDALLAEPLRGITDDGRVRHGLYNLTPSMAGGAVGPTVEAAETFLAQLDTDQRQALIFPLDADERRQWFNIHPNIYRHGLLLEDLGSVARAAALDLVAATLSSRGYRQARDIMAINGLLVELTGRVDEFGEWPYWISLFGQPSADEPWAWQLDGHHLNLNAVVIGDQVTMTPSFMGSEPCHIAEGRLAGTEVLVAEERAGLDLIRSFDATQLGTAVLRESIAPGDLPPELQHPVDGRMVAGAFADNAVIAPDGVQGEAMTEGQRRLLTRLVGTFVGWQADANAEVRMAEVTAHLDETSFCWMGGRADDGPFYYRVQSPVVLIEFDHHPGIVFDNTMPSRNHIHSILRAPNGGDYGVDLLRQHYERFDHTHP